MNCWMRVLSGGEDKGAEKLIIAEMATLCMIAEQNLRGFHFFVGQFFEGSYSIPSDFCYPGKEPTRQPPSPSRRYQLRCPPVP